MSQRINFESNVVVIGKEFLPKREEMIINNQKVASREDTFMLYILFGDKHQNCPELYNTKPTVLGVEVNKLDYLRVKTSFEISATIKSDNGKMSVIRLGEIPVIIRKDYIDEEEYFALDIAELDRMVQLQSAADVKNKK